MDPNNSVIKRLWCSIYRPSIDKVYIWRPISQEWLVYFPEFSHTIDIWYVASATGPLARLFKLWPWAQNGSISEVSCLT